MYMQATQDGIVRLSLKKTDKGITGLYTDKLATCIALIVIGEKGISLIHDTGRIQAGTIKREVEWVGKINSWAIVINPARKDRALENINRLRQMQLLPLMLNKLSKYVPYFEAKKGFVSVARNGFFINTTKKPAVIISPDEVEKRHWINTLNNYFHRGDNNYIPGDLQFDGERKLSCSHLLKTPEQMIESAKQNYDQDGINQVAGYLENFDPEMHTKLSLELYGNESVQLEEDTSSALYKAGV